MIQIDMCTVSRWSMQWNVKQFQVQDDLDKEVKKVLWSACVLLYS